jgi:hypothetical protein
MVSDTPARRQTYIEDCEVCCNPIEVRCMVDDKGVVDFETRFSGKGWRLTSTDQDCEHF